MTPARRRMIREPIVDGDRKYHPRHAGGLRRRCGLTSSSTSIPPPTASSRCSTTGRSTAAPRAPARRAVARHGLSQDARRRLRLHRRWRQDLPAARQGYRHDARACPTCSPRSPTGASSSTTSPTRRARATCCAPSSPLNPQWENSFWGVYGGDAPTDAVQGSSLPDLKAWSRKGLMACLLQYEGYGWTGIVPAACHEHDGDGADQLRRLLWGWPQPVPTADEGRGLRSHPDRPVTRPAIAGTSGVDTAGGGRAGARPDFPGYVWTNEIATIAPII